MCHVKNITLGAKGNGYIIMLLFAEYKLTNTNSDNKHTSYLVVLMKLVTSWNKRLEQEEAS